MITVNKIENGKSYSSSRLHVEITNDARFFTVWDVIADKPFATITRPLTYDRKGSWEVANTDGLVYCKTTNPRNAFMWAMLDHKAKIADGRIS